MNASDKYQLATFVQNIENNGASPGSYILMNREKEAAEYANQTGIYGVWRSRKTIYNKPQDCSRIGPSSLCFCGHTFESHNSRSKPFKPPCVSCKCEGFSFIPSRPEEIGEWWLPMRADFNADSWSCKCKCGHNHKSHEVKGVKKCRMKTCRCVGFASNFLCVVCDEHMEVHETVFETEAERRQQGLPVGMDFLPFSELPVLQDLVYGKNSIPRAVERQPMNAISGLPSSQKTNDSPVPIQRRSWR